MKKFGLTARDNEKSVKLNKLHISGNICGEYIEYTIAQHYRNLNDEDVQCTYTFPIPDTATLTGFSVSAGGKNLESKVESREEVLTILENSREENVNPIALESDEDENFQITVGDVMPNENVVIKLTYMDQMIYDDNFITLVIPSMIDPTYTFTESGEETEQDFDYYLSLLVESYGEVNITSDTHKIKVERQDETLRKVTMERGQSLDHDFVLNIEEKKPRQGDGIAYSYYDMETEKDKAILMLRFFPILPEAGSEGPKNYTFVLDMSLSGYANKEEEAKNALLIALRSLEENDKFNIITYAQDVEIFSPNGKVRFNDENLEAATQWVENLTMKEGSDIFSALKEALREAELEDEDEPDYIFLFSDDLVENEDEILDYVKTNIGNSRIFPFGFDTDTNSYFINKLAEVGYGMSEFIEEGQRLDDIILRQFNRIDNPQMDVTGIDWGEMEIEKLYPGTISYLYDREPFTIFAKVIGALEGKITIKGTVGDKEYSITADLDKLEIEENSKLIEKVWARKRIESLEEKQRKQREHDRDYTREKILELSKEFNMLSSETAFILTETIDDPVSGFGMQRIVPVDMSEDTMKLLSESFFLDDTRYSEDLNIIEKMAEKGISRGEAKKAIVFDRENLLRILARTQQADGSFKDLGEEDPMKILDTTLKALLSFCVGNEPATIYLSNINKAFMFIMKEINSKEDLLTERNLMLLSIAYEMADNKRLIKERTKNTLDKLFDDIEEGKAPKSLKEIENVVENTSLLQMKYILAAALNISSLRVDDLEEIFEKDIRSNITNIAEAALSKAL